MVYKEFKHPNYNVIGIKNDKFKSCEIEVFFSKKIKEHDLVERILLGDTMIFSTNTYKTRKDLVIKCQDLYDATVRYSVNKIGNLLNTSFSISFLCPKYVREKNYLEEVITLLFDVIFNPNVVNNSFDLRSFNITKNKLINDIKDINEDPNRVALSNALKKAFSETSTSYVMKDEQDYLKDFSSDSLYSVYNEMINKDLCDIFIIGDLDLEKTNDLISKNYRNNIIKTTKPSIYLTNKTRNKVLDIKEQGNFVQTNLIMIYNLVSVDKKDLQILPYIFNNIFGNGSLNSKLFKTLREENSLCYGVGCMYLRFDGLLVVKTSLAQENVAKAIKLIKKCLNEMIKGNFTDEELKEAKESAIFSVKMSEDYIGSVLNNYIFNYYDDFKLPEERIKVIKQVSKEDIISLAKSLKLNTIYTLEEESHEEN